MMTRQQKIAVFLMLAATAAGFLPALRCGFCGSDEGFYLVNNPLVRDLSMAGISRIFGSVFHAMYQPLVLLSYAVEYRFFGLEPAVYHATNLAFHVLNTLLVFLFISKLSKNFTVALLTALFFAIHPLRVESVVYIAERKDMLYSFFFLGAIVLYLNYLESRKRSPYLASLCLFTLSLISKPAGIMLPFMLLAVDLFRGRRADKRACWDKIPYLSLSIFFGTLALHGQWRGAVEPVKSIEPSRWILYAFHATLFYISKIFVPIKLACVYPPSAVTGMPAWQYAAACLLLVELSILVFWLKMRRQTLFGLLFFILALAPAFVIMPTNLTFSRTLVFDHYTYIPSIGIAYLSAVLWDEWRRRSESPAFKKILITTVALCVLFSSVSTWQRCKVWKNGLTLYGDVLDKYPDCVRARLCYDIIESYQKTQRKDS